MGDGKREVVAYAITHAPRGVKGGPYESIVDFGAQVPTLRDTNLHRFGYRPASKYTLARIRARHPHARVIRIVRKARPSEASAVEVLRELVRTGTTLAGKTPLPKEDMRVSLECFADEVRDVRAALTRARRVLAASGPDPMPVARAAMAWGLACKRYGGRPLDLELKTLEAVDAYRKAGGTP